MNLDELRQRLDTLDRRLLELINERQAASREIARVKRATGYPTRDYARERDVILGVRGRDHPLMAYLGARVPVALSTDDMGVSRIDLSNEYLRAARDYPLGYRALKQIARNSLDYSFLSGPEKDAQIKKFEQASADFERAVASEHGLLSNVAALIAGLFR